MGVVPTQLAVEFALVPHAGAPVHAALAALVLHALAQAAPPQADAPPPRIDADAIRALIRELPTSRSARGGESDVRGLLDTEKLIDGALRAAGLVPTLQEFRWSPPRQPDSTTTSDAPPESRTWHNIIVDLTGTKRPKEILILSAHLDAALAAPGADDDGSGLAGLITIARVFADRARAAAPTRTIRLCFFNLEETGLVGSRHYVASLHLARRDDADAPAPPETREGDRIVGMTSLEMIGYFSDAPDSQKSPIPKIEGVFDPPTVGDGIALVGFARDRVFTRALADAMRRAEPSLTLVLVDFVPAPLPDLMRSDHAPFVLAGLPGTMLTDTANFRNPNYHKPTDTLDTLDLERCARTARAIGEAFWSLAMLDEMPQPPRRGAQDTPAPLPAPPTHTK